MIKINLLAEKKQVKSRTPAGRKPEPGPSGVGQNLLLVAILIVAVAVSAIWWWNLKGQLGELRAEHEKADRELERLTEIRAKGDEYKAQKELLARKIGLITELKKRQSVPVHILDKVSRNLPDFLWLESMGANQNQINISGKATNYNAVSRFYQNLTDSGFFSDVELGRVFEVREGVAFSMSCRFVASGVGEDEDPPQG